MPLSADLQLPGKQSGSAASALLRNLDRLGTAARLGASHTATASTSACFPLLPPSSRCQIAIILDKHSFGFIPHRHRASLVDPVLFIPIQFLSPRPSPSNKNGTQVPLLIVCLHYCRTLPPFRNSSERTSFGWRRRRLIAFSLPLEVLQLSPLLLPPSQQSTGLGSPRPNGLQLRATAPGPSTRRPKQCPGWLRVLWSTCLPATITAGWPRRKRARRRP